jgi:two-component system phosphate regulon sensor histidine kinase PhoR
MDKGGVNVNQRTAQIIRFAGFLIPVVLVFYGILIQLGAIASNSYQNDQVFYLIAIPWLAVSIYQFLAAAPNRVISALRLVAYHIFTVMYILFVAGFSMPFISTWMVLFLASYAYFSHDGLRLSILAFFATAVGDILLHIDDQNHVVANLLAMLATFIIGIIAVTLSQAQEIDRNELTRSQAEELLQRDRITTIVNNLADAILSTDKNGVIQVYNAASLNLLDTNSGLEGQHIDDIVQLVDGEDKPFKLVKNFRAAKSVEAREDLSANISGERLHLSVIYSPIRSTDSHKTDGNDGYIVILRDITKQKSLEEERDEFISVVSHELRTPITIAEGTLSNVQVMMGRDDIPRTTLSDNVNVAHDQVLFLAKMVNDLSTLSRAERGVADAAEIIDVSELIHDLYNEYAPQAEAKGLHFNLDLAPQLGNVVASRLYLKELLQNFVTNSIKYTKEGEIVVSVQKHADMVTFSVKDTGIGMSKTDQAHIFEKFYRSEDYRTRETGGTGLGLYVAAKLAKKLGITIDMTSRLNHGSTFGFTMPQASKK